MRILAGKKWKDGFLDYYKNQKEYRVQVLAWKQLEKLENVYHTRAKSLRLLWNYFPVVGPEGIFTKVWSRLREERRNEKYVACGIGKILECGDGDFSEGDIVGFVAPLHPPLVERIVLPKELIYKIADLPELSSQNIAFLRQKERAPQGKWWEEIRGWSAYSGITISETVQRKLANGLRYEMEDTNWRDAEKMGINSPQATSETRGETRTSHSRDKKSGVVFGFGNYAKINILPYCKPFVDISTVHEIDPTQVSYEKGIRLWDSSPLPRQDEKYDVYFVASYNHTHVPITLHALRQGAYALVEKPVVNDREELAELEKALKQAGRKVFIGFHKRYGAFNKMAVEDLGVAPGEPVSYHSVVYELIQPEFFWYNWPVSRSTFFANGCHQIDHFLHLNGYSEPKDFDIKLMQDNAVLVWIELENGATFTTIFSEKGSLRVGPRDHVELKVHGRDVRITDNIRYMSETDSKIIRKMRVYKTHSYKTMYQEIGRKIARGEEGDSIESVLLSSKIMLDLEEKLERQKKWGDRYKKGKEEFWSNFR